MADAHRIGEGFGEVVLDARQAGWLLGGTLAAMAVVFALGVLVGRQLATAPSEAPANALAAHDATLPEIRLTYHDELTRKAAPVAPPPAPAKKKEPPPAPAAAPEQSPPAAAPQPAATALAEEPAAGAEIDEPALVVPAVPEAGTSQEKPELAAELQPEPRWTVQFGSSPQRADAERVAASLREKGLAPYVIEADIPGRGIYHRVRVGRFAERGEADRFVRDARARHGLEGAVMPAR